MPTIFKRDGSWRASIRLAGFPSESRSFHSRVEARQWAQEREAELRSGKPIKAATATLGEALRRYARDVSPSKKGARWERLRIEAMARDPFAATRLERLAPPVIAAWRDARLQQVAPGTVYREMNLLGSVLEIARREWHWLRDNPMRDVRRPKQPPPRRRRITDDEIERLCAALGYSWPDPPTNTSHRVALAFLFALETAMRSGEILSLSPATVHLQARYADLPKTKNGDARQVPLSTKAVRILELVGSRFGIEPALRDALFRKAKGRAETDVRFHDARAEAIWRLSKKLDVLQLARMIGHRDVRSLMFYYNESASELAKRLD
jgi:integrase